MATRLRMLFDLTEKFCRARVVDALKDSILLQGGVAIVHRDERHAEVVMRGCVAGLLANRSLILLHGFAVTLELVQRVAPFVVSLGVVGSSSESRFSTLRLLPCSVRDRCSTRRGCRTLARYSD